MKKEDSLKASFEVPCGRITRARAAACCVNNKVLPLIPSLANLKKQTHRGKSKRAAFDENSNVDPYLAAAHCKKRVVLKDVTNACSQKSSRQRIPRGKLQLSAVQRGKLGPSKTKRCSNSKAPNLTPAVNALTQDNEQNIISEGVQEVGILEPKDCSLSAKIGDSVELQTKDSIKDGEEQNFRESLEDINHTKNGFVNNVKFKLDDDLGGFNGLDFIDIDTDLGNPQMCCTYAPEIYTYLLAAELIRRPVSDFMETLQRDVTESMRGILIDWLVEVSEEYKLVPDTLYLTVYMIDQFLSQNYIERQRLQLLGITCMLIASKYEEICTPRVEQFCLITDNTYTKAEEQVLKMESQVLSYLGFQLSVPTTKTFLRRFLRAAHASNKAPTLTLGYLANYLAELTLLEYSFIKFLPSVIAASAVFLARWTLDQSSHPWNPTLEYYTSYKATDLKVTIFALQELQMNSKSCPLNAIREKYRQEKFECVAAIASLPLVESLFS
ncbi:cyclin-A2-1-like isoform X1 [Musa acuminata AAA Group]|uniref:cyclin-A2-1-like isoform X1 n=1 Tax=Musa acuminata AAA Group TaxID=214697 RepID=UPI0031D83E58